MRVERPRARAWPVVPDVAEQLLLREHPLTGRWRASGAARTPSARAGAACRRPRRRASSGRSRAGPRRATRAPRRASAGARRGSSRPARRTGKAATRSRRSRDGTRARRSSGSASGRPSTITGASPRHRSSAASSPASTSRAGGSAAAISSTRPAAAAAAGTLALTPPGRPGTLLSTCSRRYRRLRGADSRPLRRFCNESSPVALFGPVPPGLSGRSIGHGAERQS